MEKNKARMGDSEEMRARLLRDLGKMKVVLWIERKGFGWKMERTCRRRDGGTWSRLELGGANGWSVVSC